MKLLVAILVGAALGLIGARYVFVGSWLSLIPWASAGLAIGWWAKQLRQAMLNGAVYGFVLSFVFMIAGYTGSAALISRLPFFAILGAFGGVCGLVLGLVGAWVRGRLEKTGRSGGSRL
jgi:Na+(H+)/acetate symporter ActP